MPGISFIGSTCLMNKKKTDKYNKPTKSFYSKRRQNDFVNKL